MMAILETSEANGYAADCYNYSASESEIGCSTMDIQHTYYAGMYIATHVGAKHKPLILFMTYYILHTRYL